MADTIFTPPAQAIVDHITALAIAPLSAQGYLWAQTDLERIPAGIVGLPRFRRTGPDEAEPELRSDGQNPVGAYYITYPVNLFVDFDEPNASAALMVDLVQLLVRAIDTDPTLGGMDGVGQIGDPRVTLGEPSLDNANENRPLLTYDLEVEVPRLVIP